MTDIQLAGFRMIADMMAGRSETVAVHAVEINGIAVQHTTSITAAHELASELRAQNPGAPFVVRENCFGR